MATRSCEGGCLLQAIFRFQFSISVHQLSDQFGSQYCDVSHRPRTWNSRGRWAPATVPSIGHSAASGRSISLVSLRAQAAPLGLFAKRLTTTARSRVGINMAPE